MKAQYAIAHEKLCSLQRDVFTLIPPFLSHGTREMAQHLTSLAALLKDLGLIPNTHGTAHNYL